MLKKAVSEAAGKSKPEAYPLGYVEDFDEPRTKLGVFFIILITCIRLCAVTPFLALRLVLVPIVRPPSCVAVPQ